MADRNRHSSRADSFEDRMFAEITAGDDMAHLGEGDGDGTHARSTDPHHMESVRNGKVKRWNRHRKSDRPVVGGSRHDVSDVTATRSIKPAKAPDL